jgi:hypothetical protein
LNNSTDFDDDFLEDVSDKDLLNTAEGSTVKDAGKFCLYNQTKAVKKGTDAATSCASAASSLGAADVEIPGAAEVNDIELLSMLVQVENAGSK